MNPFEHVIPPAPPGACGERGFKSHEEAKAAVESRQDLKTFVILHWRGEYAWVSPIEVFLSRVGICLGAGIRAVEVKPK